MKSSGLASLSLLASLTLSSAVLAQQPLPPPPGGQPEPAPAPGPGVPGAPGTEAPPPAAQPGWGAPPAAGAPAGDPNAAGASGNASWSLGGGMQSGGATTGGGSTEMDPETERQWRHTSLMIQNNLKGSTGLLHTSYAGSGAPGSLRVGFITSYFKGSDFLCGGGQCNYNVAANPEGKSDDEVTRIGAHLSMNATLFPFLEAYMGFHASATENDQSRPRLLQVLGDTNLGLKGFLPYSPDSIFSVGGELQLWLLNGTGGVGLDGSGTSYAIRALATADLNNRTNPDDRVPLRFNANVGYLFDNSGELVGDTESARKGQKITRIERYGLDINRVDSFQIGLGLEGMFDYIHPFAEWTIDVPMNRQNYTCNESRKEVGDGCLGNDAGFSSSPSRVTLGARAYPGIDGLSLLAGFDIGTGATSKFIQEVAPESPWTLYLGLGWAADTKKEPPIIKEVQVDKAPMAAPSQDRYILGHVVEKGANTPVANAIIRFDGRAMSGMVSSDDGSFRTINLEPGTYTFTVKADGYRDGQCQATIAMAAPMGYPGAPAMGQPGMGQPGMGQPGMGQPGMGQPGMAPAPAMGQQPVTPMNCELEALPKVGNIVGGLVDGDNQQPIANASVKITDMLNRELELAADGSGAFRFENVPPGAAKITVTAQGYFTSVTELEVKPQEDLKATISLNKRPKAPNVTVAANELKLKKQVHFAHDAATIEPDSAALLEEIADVLKNRAEIAKLEIQGHTDNTGSPVYNQRLSQQRADAVRDNLMKLGVDGGRLEAKGYGQDKPLVPNVSPANRARNRRVQLMITQKSK
ncbi:MAG: carboxypeptidase regulatory-like domain-containing protein [Myxococcales bacterium]|nr:carboxypeptidase regulatory-like domain-containing protein [Myxococcales bacterium]